jgi:hypothetical protein
LKNRIELRRANDLGEIERTWALEEDVFGADFTAEGDETLLTNGLRINLWSGDRRQLSALPDCTGVALLPEGGALGISKGGTVRVWRD